jgi:hemoglobin
VETLYAAMGGGEVVRAVAHHWHERVIADPVVSHAFEFGFRAEHTERLAAYWAEVLGGPAEYSASMGDETNVVRIHSGNGPHDEMDRRAVDCFAAALVDAGVPEDVQPELVAWFRRSNEYVNHRWQRPEDVPEGLPMPIVQRD